MNYIQSFANNIRHFYNTINPASLTGAIDVIVVEQPDGSLLSTPFHVRFGKYGVFNNDEKYVDIMINGVETNLKMKLGEDGATFYARVSDEEPTPMAQISYVRSLRLSSDELKALQLQYGMNEVRYSITTKLQGTSWCTCHIYLYKYSDLLVISDIDGTITKSDVLGHIIAAIGGQWAHAGVVELYSKIKQNGYKMVYLSSRAIGQSHTTKVYLQSVAQGSKTLPDGPVLLSPSSVLMAFRKEVIERKPEEFKIACLSDLKSLFPQKQPFFAGFGNRETDVLSYSAVNIPAERILIINPSGTVKRSDCCGFSSSYPMMAMEMVDYFFPPLQLSPCLDTAAAENEETTSSTMKEEMRGNFTKPETCSTFTHWRNPPSDTVLDDDELAEYEKRRKAMSDKNNSKKSRK